MHPDFCLTYVTCGRLSGRKKSWIRQQYLHTPDNLSRTPVGARIPRWEFLPNDNNMNGTETRKRSDWREMWPHATRWKYSEKNGRTHRQRDSGSLAYWPRASQAQYSTRTTTIPCLARSSFPSAHFGPDFAERCDTPQLSGPAVLRLTRAWHIPLVQGWEHRPCCENFRCSR